jgi:L-threonylcarbamoyladenylate synthase
MAGVEQAVAAIQAGEAVILPTDTVYGLCASPDDEAALARVYELKGRPESMPIALVCADVDALLRAVFELPEHDVRALLPGPFTLVLPNRARRFPLLNAGETIGVRVPELTGAAHEVLSRVGAVAATSANRHGGPDPRRLEDVPSEIRDACGAEIDGGDLPGTPSTVVDLTRDEPRILREGAVSAAEALSLLS